MNDQTRQRFDARLRFIGWRMGVVLGLTMMAIAQGGGYAQRGGGGEKMLENGATGSASKRFVIGRVVDSSLRPVAGAMVAVVLPMAVPIEQLPPSVRTNRNGDFTVTWTGPETVRLSVIKAGYKQALFRVKSETEDFVTALDTLAEAGSRLKIRLVDETGNPVAGARLVVKRAYDCKAYREETTCEMLTDERGAAEYTFKAPSDAPCTAYCLVSLAEPGYCRAFVGRSLMKDDEVRLVVRKAGDTWRGRVLDAAGAPIGGARVKIQTWTGSGGVRSGSSPFIQDEFRSDAQGFFELTGFSRKDGVLAEIGAPLHCPVDAVFEGESGYTFAGGTPARDKEKWNTGGVFRLAAGGDLVGRLVDRDGRPFTKSCRVDLVGKLPIPYAGVFTRGTTTTAEGTFAFEGLVPFDKAFPLERYKSEDRARIRPEDLGWHLSFKSFSHDPREWRYVWTEPRAVDVRVGETTRIDIRMEEGVAVEGRVVNAVSGKPYVDDVMAHFTRPGVAFESFFPVEDETGHWQTWLAPGVYQYYFYNTGGPQIVEEMKTVTVKGGGGAIDVGTIGVGEK